MNVDSKTRPRNSSLPLLPEVNITSPCPMNWETMDGDQTRRFCGACQKHVYQFEEMHSDEVSTLLASGDSVCARILRRPDGSIVTNDTRAVSEPSITRHKWLSPLVALATSLLAILTIGGCKEPVEAVMGDVASPPAVEAPLLGEVCLTEEMGGARANPQTVVQAPSEPVRLLGKVGPQETSPD